MMRDIHCFKTYVSAVIKIMCVLAVALGTPWLCVYYMKDAREAAERRPVLGIEEFTDTMLNAMIPSQSTCACKAGLIIDANTYRTSGREHIALLRARGVCIRTLFVLEDGIAYNHKKISPGIRTISIAQDQYQRLAQHTVADCDCIMIDIQETGYAPYDGAPLIACFQLARASDKPVMVFDRPNILGSSVEGCGIWLGARASVPYRHGMTIGELAKFCNRYLLDTPVALHVVPMKHYQRTTQEQMPLMSGYCMRGFIDIMHEIKPFEIRTSSNNKAQCIMLPVEVMASKRMWRELSIQLKRVGIEGTLYEWQHESTGHAYLGLALSVQDAMSFSFNSALLMVLRFFNDAGVSLSYSERLRDMIGMHAIQSYIAGAVTEKEVRSALAHEAQLFLGKALGSFLYQPLPKVMEL